MSAVIPQLLSHGTLQTALQPFFFNGLTPVILGVIYLAFVRDFLFEERIVDYNTEAQLHRSTPCSSRELKYRYSLTHPLRIMPLEASWNLSNLASQIIRSLVCLIPARR